MDLMSIRRGLMSQMAQKKYLWKTVTLEEDHTSDSTGLITYWVQFLGIQSQDDKENYTWAIVFQNNTLTNIAADFICGVYNGNTFKSMSARDKWSNLSASQMRSMYASTGTVIYVFKLPR